MRYLPASASQCILFCNSVFDEHNSDAYVIAEPEPERKGGCCSGACPQCPRCCGCRRCGGGGCSGGCCNNCPRDY
ncbi:hypothetical protein EWB00_000594 [Schistosoma japonicum]|uniref:Uncharacterized protein n=1 Tax=Schistosoma japonicum TaxID=6182 RepID=A0A4Z2DIB8_SCHJA|nr:hypothetical protein EWB00_000594 [Schistosoma japonicum]